MQNNDHDVKTQLEIFNEEMHPSLIKGVGRSKEGFSIFSSFLNTVTLGGRKLLQEWFSQPLINPIKINKRLVIIKCIKEWIDQDNTINLCVKTCLNNIICFKKFFKDITKRDTISLLSVSKLYRSLIECKNLIKIVDKYFKDQHEFSLSIQNLVKDQAKEDIEFLLYTLEEIFDTELLLK